MAASPVLRAPSVPGPSPSFSHSILLLFLGSLISDNSEATSQAQVPHLPHLSKVSLVCSVALTISPDPAPTGSYYSKSSSRLTAGKPEVQESTPINPPTPIPLGKSSLELHFKALIRQTLANLKSSW